MRYTKFLCFFFMALLAVSAVGKQPKDKKKYGVYLAGVSASFTDSLVYLQIFSIWTVLLSTEAECW